MSTPQSSSKLELENKRHKRKAPVMSFNVYIYKLLRNLRPNVAITKEGICMLDNFVHHLGFRLSTGLAVVKKYSKTKTVSMEDVHTTLILFLGTEEANKIHAVAQEHITNYQDFVLQKKELKEMAADSGETEPHRPMQQNVKAGLNFSVSRMQRVFISDHKRISKTSMIYFTAVIEHIVSNILNETIVIIQELHKQRIKTSHLNTAIKTFRKYRGLTKKVYYPLS